MGIKIDNFILEKKKNIKKLGEDYKCKQSALDFINKTYIHQYS